MKVVVQQSALARELQLASEVIDRKVTIPVLSHVLLTAGEDGLTVSATNIDSAVQSRIPDAEVLTPGCAVVPASLLLGLVGRMPVGGVALELQKDRVIVRAGGSVAQLQTLDVADFPLAVVTRPDDAPVLTVPASQLLALVRRVRYAMHATPATYAHQGALCEAEGDELRLVATDGHQLAFAAHTLAAATTAPVRWSMAERAWGALAKWLGLEADDTPVSLVVLDRKVWWTAAHRAMAFALLEQSYPVYQRILAAAGKGTTRLDLPREHFAGIAKRHLVLADVSNPKVTLSIERRAVKVTTSSPAGNIDDTIAIDDGPSTALEIVLNLRYLLNILEALDGEEAVRLTLKSPLDPIKWQPATDATAALVVMPMHP